jgi:hypothetical protein
MEMENGNGGREIQERLKAGIESYTWWWMEQWRDKSQCD